MQPQPDQNKSKHATTTASAKAKIVHQKQQQQQQQHQQQIQKQQKRVVSTAVTKSTPPSQQLKILKSKRPLSNFKFYLDICDHQLTKRIEEQVKTLGGTLEFFLTDSVTHFITDKTVLPPLVGGGGGVGVGISISSNNNNSNNQSHSHPNTPQTPATPNTPKTPCGTALEANDARLASGPTSIGTARKTRQSRADAILNRARRQSGNLTGAATAVAAATTPKSTAAGLLNTRRQSNTATTSAAGESEKLPTYKIWQTEQALLFFKKVGTELREYLNSSHKAHGSSSHAHVISLKGSFIKIEAIKNNYRPYYHLFKKPDEWPKIDLSSDDGAFRLQERQKPALITADAVAQQQVMTRKSRTRTSQQNQQHKRTASTIGVGNKDEPQTLTPLPAAIQVLKQQDRCKSNNTTATTTPNTPNCREAKESSDKQCGVCEICKIEYDTLTIHLKTKDHEYFTKNPDNFIALDTLIQSTADVNKFLSTENIQQHRHVDDVTAIAAAELEEMEVDESLCNADENVTDPLEEVSVSPNSNGSDLTKRRPSPALREKSKRSTKGKHSSEKFQSKRTTPKQSPTKPISPKKRAATACLVETKRNENLGIVTVIATTPATTRRKACAQNSTLSPPIRAMLPPSSLYKVVDPVEVYTPPPARSRRGNMGIDIIEPAATASPSIIVKFQKVRQNELQRLNGEAESFMFPKTRSSSELPTDVDRQTTSDHARVSMSSTSLDSTSESDVTLATTTLECNSIVVSDGINRRKIAIAKRRKCIAPAAGATATTRKLSTGSNSSTSRQRFRSAPIQPETQLRASIKAVSIRLPEATRKSSRTATAIVSKATKSSRLLRAQVEAAKQTNRRQQQTEAIAMPTPAKVKSNTSTLVANRPNNKAVENLEDGMGDNSVAKRSKRKVKSKVILEKETYDAGIENDDDVNGISSKYNAGDGVDDVDDDEDDDDDDDDDNDDANDKDYVASKQIKCPVPTPSTLPRVDSRDERAARRFARLSLPKTSYTDEDDTMTPLSTPANAKLTRASNGFKEKASSRKQGKTNTSASSGLSCKSKQQKQSTTTPYTFDYTKSEYVSKLNYAFESQPATDLWHRVYMRQDAGEERYHSYFGSTNYRKLPYEMGPISLDSTLKLLSNCCTLCRGKKLEDDANIKKELPVETKCTAPLKSVNTPEVALDIKHEQVKSASYRHKKLHLLERYQQEQQSISEQEIKKTENIDAKMDSKLALSLANSTAITKCDSKASTPELFEREFSSLNVNELHTGAEQVRSSSAHSNASSSCISQSSTTSQNNKHRQFRHKQLNRIAELPPRKSPREHASTLALFSCIIRQRQDSLSRNNSEVDEPPTTPTPTRLPPNSLCKLEEIKTKPEELLTETKPIVAQLLKTPTKRQSPVPVEKSIGSPRTTRSAASTPIEELRFATEISENVKRMRRGQNKYDHSPPVVPRSARGRGRPPQSTLPVPNSKISGGTFSRRLVLATKQELTASEVLGKRQRRVKAAPKLKVGRQRAANSNCFANNQTATSALTNTANGVVNLPGIRKICTKKGVLEYEFDASAMKTMSKPTESTNSTFDAWLIDKYLELAGREYDMDVAEMDVANTTDYMVDYERNADALTIGHVPKAASRIAALKAEVERANTPPPTDCFTSDFDLYDLLTVRTNGVGGASGDDDEIRTASRRNSFCFYSSSASLQSYYRKRKSLKSNRTGWPKVQKRKTSARQQKLNEDCISFQKIGIGTDMPVQIKEEPIDMAEIDDGDLQGMVEKVQTIKLNNDLSIVNLRRSGNRNTGGGDGVITPPATDDDERVSADVTSEIANNDKKHNEILKDGEVDIDIGVESIPDDDETMAGSVELEDDEEDEEEENAPEVEIEATDADIEEDGDDDDEEQDEEEEDDGDNDNEDAEDDKDVVDDDDDEFEDAYDHDANDTDVFDDTRTGENIKNQQASTAAIQEDDIELSANTEFIKGIKERINRSNKQDDAEDNEEDMCAQNNPNKVLIALLNAKSSTPATSTPATTPTMLRQHTQIQQQSLRRTPQLNGSLGSCISPSEKLGDTSDIFTVSSDGLDTDLDLSNPHTQLKSSDSPESELQSTHQCPHQTPKRKFDIGRYAPNAAKASTCAAEAATAAVKSLAISQFLKKEVRVTCRRLRAPFRRFRYRR